MVSRIYCYGSWASSTWWLGFGHEHVSTLWTKELDRATFGTSSCTFLRNGQRNKNYQVHQMIESRRNGGTQALGTMLQLWWALELWWTIHSRTPMQKIILDYEEYQTDTARIQNNLLKFPWMQLLAFGIYRPLWLKLEGFLSSVKYRTKRLNTLADALSRWDVDASVLLVISMPQLSIIDGIRR